MYAASARACTQDGVASWTAALKLDSTDIHRIRRRDGAIQWGLYHDLTEPKRFLETFVVESWVEHLRQHSRATVSDRALIDLARSFHSSDSPPQITYFIYRHKSEDKS